MDVKKRCTPLYLAAQAEPEPAGVAMATLLLQRGADVDKRTTEDASTPLWNAVRCGHADVVALLLLHGANADADVDACTWVCGNLDCMTQLEERVNCAAVKKVRTTPLLTAAKKGHAGIVRLLLEHGATVDKAADDGSTAFYVATQNGHEEAAKLLEAAGASPDFVVCPIKSTAAVDHWSFMPPGFMRVDRGGRPDRGSDDWLGSYAAGRSTAIFYVQADSMVPAVDGRGLPWTVVDGEVVSRGPEHDAFVARHKSMCVRQKDELEQGMVARAKFTEALIIRVNATQARERADIERRKRVYRDWASEELQKALAEQQQKDGVAYALSATFDTYVHTGGSDPNPNRSVELVPLAGGGPPVVLRLGLPPPRSFKAAWTRPDVLLKTLRRYSRSGRAAAEAAEGARLAAAQSSL